MSFHHATLLSLLAASLAVAVGCKTTTVRPGGGDGDGGGYPWGGTGGASASTWTSSQTSTGETCDYGGCEACQQCLAGPGGACESMYSACVNEGTMCDATVECFEAGCVMTCGDTGTGGGSPTSTIPGSMCDGGGDCEACGQCAQQGDCADQTAACVGNDECLGFNECYNQCQDEACADACYQAWPNGFELYMAFAVCIICDVCPSDCDAASRCN